MQTITRWSCPLCPWQLDDEGPSVKMQVAAFDPYSILWEHKAGIEGELRAHMETHKLEEWAAEVVRLQNELKALRS